MLLSIRNITVHYGRVEALRDVSIEVEEGHIVTLIGANGAGKSTTLRTISGLKRPTSGEIWFNGERIDGYLIQKIVGLGIGHVPEGKRLFPDLTVLGNLRMGAYLRKDKKETNEDLQAVFEHFPILKERAGQRAGSLSGGEQQMLAIGRALMSRPRLLLLDEPSLGLSPIMTKEIASIITDIHHRGVSVLLIEQNARLALRLAQWGYVLETGRIVLEGKSDDLLQNEQVKELT